MSRQKLIIVIALMLGMSMTSLEATIVGTAMPTIVGKLGGITLYSWVTSIYLLTSTITIPIYGKLADLYGRKPVFLIGSTIFLLGSLACGGAQSMVQLILARALQGLGAGAVMPMVLTIVGDIFALEERAKVQGFFSGVWGVSSIFGPLLGGVLVDYLDWRWVFFINIPFGIVSLIMLAIFFREQIERKKPQLDYIGTLALTGGVIALLFAVLQGGEAWSWGGWQSITLFAVAAIALVGFIFVEKRASEPILPLSLFTNRIIVISNIGGVIVGIVMFGITSFVPLFMQGVKGGSGTDAGLILGPLLLAWPLSALIAGRFVLQTSYRLFALMGTSLIVLGVGTVLSFNPQTPQWLIIVSMVGIGMGLGFSNVSFTLSVQNAVPWRLRGVATASLQFFRTIGGTIGVAIMGAILNAQMSQLFAPIYARHPDAARHLPTGVAPANVLLEPQVRAQLPADFLGELQNALSQGLFWIYLLTFIFALLGLVVMFWLPAGRPDQFVYREEPAKDTLPESGTLAQLG